MTLAGWCRQYQVLPEAGALMDQDAALMERMAVLDNIFHTVQRYYSLGARVNTDLSMNERLLLEWLDNERMLGGLNG